MSGKELYYAQRKAHPLTPDGSPPTPWEELTEYSHYRWEQMAGERLQGIIADLVVALKDGLEFIPTTFQGRALAAIAKTEEMAIRTDEEILGRWTPVTEAMPDDELTVLVWVSSLDEATLAYHCSEVLEKRGDSGWIQAGSGRGSKRVLLGVTHWCAEIYLPKQGRVSA